MGLHWKSHKQTNRNTLRKLNCFVFLNQNQGLLLDNCFACVWVHLYMCVHCVRERMHLCIYLCVCVRVHCFSDVFACISVCRCPVTQCWLYLSSGCWYVWNSLTAARNRRLLSRQRGMHSETYHIIRKSLQDNIFLRDGNMTTRLIDALQCIQS